MSLLSNPFGKKWMARKLRESGLHEAADDIHAISREESRAMHNRQARETQRKAERRARRRRTLTGRLLNFLRM